MKTYNFLTLFPEMIHALNTSMIKKAVDKNIVCIQTINIRDFSENKHKKVDDYPYGGGQGMIMTCQPVLSAYNSLPQKQHCIYLSPKGKSLNQEKAKSLTKHDHITFLCGHYEGIDQRIIDKIVDEEISIGDYVLTGGELPAMIVADAVIRLLPGVLTSSESYIEESHYNGLLEYPHYTRPEEYDGLTIPAVLRSGNHEQVKKYRLQQSLLLTFIKRPDMLKSRGITPDEADFLIDSYPQKRDVIITYIKEEKKNDQ